MSALSNHVEDYLRLRRALGFKLQRPGVLLPRFVSWLEAAGAATITLDLAVAWARLPEHVQPVVWAQRLGVVRGFARYMHTIDSATEIPPAGIFAVPRQRPTPHVYSTAEASDLLHAARALRPPLRAATYEALFGLLLVSGMRVGEAIGLAGRDVDLDDGVITVRRGKFDRARLVPLHPTATEALRGYDIRRDHLCPTPRTDRFLVSSVGTTLLYSGVHTAFVQASTAAGLRAGTRRPRIHDMRHSVAVNTLTAWRRDHADVTSRLPVLSTYLGHLNPAGTYWYLTATPELMQLAATRLDAPAGSRL